MAQASSSVDSIESETQKGVTETETEIGNEMDDSHQEQELTPEPEEDAESHTVINAEEQPECYTEVQLEISSVKHPEDVGNQPEVDTEVQPETNTEVQPEVDTQPEFDVEIQLENDVENQPEIDPEHSQLEEVEQMDVVENDLEDAEASKEGEQAEEDPLHVTSGEHKVLSRTNGEAELNQEMVVPGVECY